MLLKVISHQSIYVEYDSQVLRRLLDTLAGNDENDDDNEGFAYTVTASISAVELQVPLKTAD